MGAMTPQEYEAFLVDKIKNLRALKDWARFRLAIQDLASDPMVSPDRVLVRVYTEKE